MKFQVTYSYTEEQIEDLMVAALEGGINYWCTQAQMKEAQTAYISEDFAKGKTLRLKDDMGVWHELTHENFKKGVEMACEHYETTPDALYEDHDAETADVIIQYALFDEIVYG